MKTRLRCLVCICVYYAVAGYRLLVGAGSSVEIFDLDKKVPCSVITTRPHDFLEIMVFASSCSCIQLIMFSFRLNLNPFQQPREGQNVISELWANRGARLGINRLERHHGHKAELTTVQALALALALFFLSRPTGTQISRSAPFFRLRMCTCAMFRVQKVRFCTSKIQNKF